MAIGAPTVAQVLVDLIALVDWDALLVRLDEGCSMVRRPLLREAVGICADVCTDAREQFRLVAGALWALHARSCANQELPVIKLENGRV